MERVAFLVESSGERISCLLNPESLLVERSAGVRPRRSIGGSLRAAALSDDPVLVTGGGTTELTLELLFDVGIAASSAETPVGDVRQLTLPLWRLAESARADESELRPGVVRFVWGKAWNVPAVVVSVAERFESFAADGSPRRSWMKLRLLRVAEPDRPQAFDAGDESDGDVHEVLGAGVEEEEEAAPAAGGERLEDLAQKYYGDPSAWKLIAEANAVDDPLHLEPGAVLRIPAREAG
ncbi:MAG TPA: hypothetical protein VGH20_06980 [Myxococcales bacterium]|jgi:hypothetical protein